MSLQWYGLPSNGAKAALGKTAYSTSWTEDTISQVASEPPDPGKDAGNSDGRISIAMASSKGSPEGAFTVEQVGLDGQRQLLVYGRQAAPGSNCRLGMDPDRGPAGQAVLRHGECNDTEITCGRRDNALSICCGDDTYCADGAVCCTIGSDCDPIIHEYPSCGTMDLYYYYEYFCCDGDSYGYVAPNGTPPGVPDSGCAPYSYGGNKSNLITPITYGGISATSITTPATSITITVTASPGTSTTAPTGATNPTSDSDSDSPSSSPSTNTGAIAGGVVGGVLGLALLLAVIVVLLRRRKQPETLPELDTGDAAAKREHAELDGNPVRAELESGRLAHELQA
ncbi:hypothetical protein BJX61DRAFT_544714 [Aspergillus egyptiacus]|nr:hypothetical protein BJX61DRAFT_544714 [Aspergillus egyptiacus]